MVTERQVIAVLGVVAAITTLGFAVYNLYKTFYPNQTVRT